MRLSNCIDCGAPDPQVLGQACWPCFRALVARKKAAREWRRTVAEGRHLRLVHSREEAS